MRLDGDVLGNHEAALAAHELLGYAVGNTLVVRLTLAALTAAVQSRTPEPGLIHHSDRDAQYAVKAYRDRIYATIDDVKTRLAKFIDEIYNARRLHSALRYLPPDEFELRNAR
jgi:putative transposase